MKTNYTALSRSKLDHSSLTNQNRQLIERIPKADIDFEKQTYKYDDGFRFLNVDDMDERRRK